MGPFIYNTLYMTNFVHYANKTWGVSSCMAMTSRRLPRIQRDELCRPIVPFPGRA